MLLYMTTKTTNTSIVFVTGIFCIYEKDYDIVHKTIDKRIEYFEEFASLGLNICVYTDDIYIEKIQLLEKKYSNVIVHNIHNIYLTNFGKMLLEYEKEIDCKIKLPQVKNEVKDTREFMFIMNLKTELIRYAINANIFNGDYYAWFDFGIGYILKNKTNTLEYVKLIPTLKLVEQFVYIPGCWDTNNERWKNLLSNDDYLINNILWRFCGGIFMGDKQSLLDFCNLCENSFMEFLKKYNTLVWEVNYWAWIEREKNLNIVWEYRNHDDNMLFLPQQIQMQIQTETIV